MRHRTFQELLEAVEVSVAAGKVARMDDGLADQTIGVSYDDGTRDSVLLSSLKNRRGGSLEWSHSAPRWAEALARLNCGAPANGLHEHVDCPRCDVRRLLDS